MGDDAGQKFVPEIVKAEPIVALNEQIHKALETWGSVSTPSALSQALFAQVRAEASRISDVELHACDRLRLVAKTMRVLGVLDLPGQHSQLLMQVAAVADDVLCCQDGRLDGGECIKVLSIVANAADEEELLVQRGGIVDEGVGTLKHEPGEGKAAVIANFIKAVQKISREALTFGIPGSAADPLKPITPKQHSDAPLVEISDSSSQDSFPQGQAQDDCDVVRSAVAKAAAFRAASLSTPSSSTASASIISHSASAGAPARCDASCAPRAQATHVQASASNPDTLRSSPYAKASGGLARWASATVGHANVSAAAAPMATSSSATSSGSASAMVPPGHAVVPRAIENDIFFAPTLGESAAQIVATRSQQVPQRAAQPATRIRSFAAPGPSIAEHDVARPLQTRRAWTDDEEQRLITGVQRYGHNWETIRTSCSLKHRTGVQLKDKWRNLKNSGVV